ncbi:1131_t:CDS:2 [Acaulospora colombiana]|uniref:1131_t:CDS:1 n=1 Tax=Acaulospora colombiana TaxID=27376 RepID=A0ACA9KPH4_9GLOM|nr:1131_t:CDS:2 [Acaulospora colombiana]
MSSVFDNSAALDYPPSHQKDDQIKELKDQITNLTNELRNRSPDQFTQNDSNIRQELKKAISRVVDDVFQNETFSQTHVPHSSAPVEGIPAYELVDRTLSEQSALTHFLSITIVNQSFSTTIESEEHVASSSTSVNHPFSLHNNFTSILGHSNHESADSDYNSRNDLRAPLCESNFEENMGLRFNNENKQMPNMHVPMSLQTPQRRFNHQGGMNDNNNNNNGQRLQNKNFNNRPQNKQNGYGQPQKNFNYPQGGGMMNGVNGVNGIGHHALEDHTDLSISNQGMQILISNASQPFSSLK